MIYEYYFLYEREEGGFSNWLRPGSKERMPPVGLPLRMSTLSSHFDYAYVHHAMGPFKRGELDSVVYQHLQPYIEDRYPRYTRLIDWEA